MSVVPTARMRTLVQVFPLLHKTGFVLTAHYLFILRRQSPSARLTDPYMQSEQSRRFMNQPSYGQRAAEKHGVCSSVTAPQSAGMRSLFYIKLLKS